MAEVDRATLVLDGDNSRLKRAVAGARATLGKGLARIRRIATRIGQVVAGAMAAAGVAAVKFAGDFEQSMTRLQTLVGINRGVVERWKGELKGIAAATGVPLQNLSRAMFAVTSGGLRGAEALETLRQAAKASVVGLGDVESIGRTATAALQAFGDTGLSATESIDQMVATVRAGNLRAEELAGSLGRVMGIASTMGVRFSDLNAFIATFTRLGTSAEESATSLRAILQGLTGTNQKAAEAFRELEIPMADVRRQIREKGLVQGLRTMIDAAGGNIEVLTDLVPNIRALAGFLGTAGTQSEDFARIQGEVRKAMGLTNEGFETARGTLNNMAARLREVGRVALVSIGEQMLPLVKDLTSALEENLPRLIEGVVHALGRAGLVVVRLASAVRTDAGQAFLNLGLVLGARLGQGLFRGLETVLRETNVLAKLPGKVGEFFDRINLAALGVGKIADMARGSAEEAVAALDILAGAGGLEDLKSLMEGLSTLTVGGGAGGTGGAAGQDRREVNLFRALGLPHPAELSRIVRSRLSSVMGPAFGPTASAARTALGQARQGAPFAVGGPLQLGSVERFTETAERAKTMLKDSAGDLGSSFSDRLGEELKRGGRFAMQSLLQGLLKGKDNIGESLVNIGLSIGSQLLTGGLFSVLGIASPAQAGVYGGEMLGLGLVRGMQRMRPRIQRAGSGLAMAAVGGMGAGVSMSAGARSEVAGAARQAPIDASNLDPLGQMWAEVATEIPSLQRLFTAGVRDADRRAGRG